MDTATVLITTPHIWKMLLLISTPRQLWIRWYYISNKLKSVKVFPVDFIWTVYFTSGIFSSGQLYYLWRFHTCKCRRRIRYQVWWWSQRWWSWWLGSGRWCPCLRNIWCFNIFTNLAINHHALCLLWFICDSRSERIEWLVVFCLKRDTLCVD